MIHTLNTRLLAATPLALLLAACGGTAEAPQDAAAGEVAAASGDAPAELELRHENFEAIGDAFKAIRAQFEGDSPDLAVVAASATDINTRAAAIKDHFPAGSGRDAGWDTEALPTIWEKPEEFAAAQQKLLDESAKMIELANSGDVAATGEQIAALGGSCKNCHDTFRMKDE